MKKCKECGIKFSPWIRGDKCPDCKNGKKASHYNDPDDTGLSSSGSDDSYFVPDFGSSPYDIGASNSSNSSNDSDFSGGGGDFGGGGSSGDWE